jgi:hypothetical protein
MYHYYDNFGVTHVVALGLLCGFLLGLLIIRSINRAGKEHSRLMREREEREFRRENMKVLEQRNGTTEPYRGEIG